MVTENTSDNLSMGEAVGRYLATLPNEKKNAAQQEINNFIRWYGGRDKLFVRLNGSVVGNYAERLTQTDTSSVKKLELVREFLSYAYKQSWCQENLAVSVRIIRKSNPKNGKTKKKEKKKEPTYVSQKAYGEMKVELKDLKKQSLVVTDDIKRAAADKDFRENAPYHAAREQKGLIEGKIMELEQMISSAVIIEEERKPTHTVAVGDTVILQELNSNREVRYTLVGPREVNPTQGKISAVSPVGKAVIGRSAGDSIEVMVPAGRLYYQLKSIK